MQRESSRWVSGTTGYPAQATMPKMIARYMQSGQSLKKIIGWAESELEGFMRV